MQLSRPDNRLYNQQSCIVQVWKVSGQSGSDVPFVIKIIDALVFPSLHNMRILFIQLILFFNSKYNNNGDT